LKLTDEEERKKKKIELGSLGTRELKTEKKGNDAPSGNQNEKPNNLIRRRNTNLCRKAIESLRKESYLCS
jgi:hypothetical protein